MENLILNNTADKNISYLIVGLGDEKYAMHVSHVISIHEMMKITAIPLCPDYMKGIINLRGIALPVIDLRIKFGMEPSVYTSKTGIVVHSFKIEDEDFAFAVIVDSVEEVLEIAPELIGHAPTIGNRFSTKFISGTVNINNEFILMLDLIKLFTLQELESVKEMNEATV
jgi:purine-binding chemotaxis protein CheW